ncbi:hypothetical protein [Polyangium aurulentum]|uniref:hypothetical protein n=1 Tax=Polyangium aurulentum TaxID=2567896 RepID=UPI0010AE7ED7|nr:hypothetical protein [Polyangium aurulentum]UQA56750.1 hypothetical protein E8A73_036430 [Polyangium aurulentum]
MNDSETKTKGQGPGGPLEIDSGTRLQLTNTSGSTVYVIIYRALTQDPPAGFSPGEIYYCIENALPTDHVTLTLQVTNGTSNPHFAASAAVHAASASYHDLGSSSTPPASSSLWVSSNNDWAIEWNVTGTGPNASGTVRWWNDSNQPIAPTAGTHTLQNQTRVNSNVTYMSQDTLTADTTTPPAPRS